MSGLVAPEEAAEAAASAMSKAAEASGSHVEVQVLFLNSIEKAFCRPASRHWRAPMAGGSVPRHGQVRLLVLAMFCYICA